jgi:cardiolipin synthase
MKKDKILTIPNILSILRLFMVPVFVVFILKNLILVAFFIFVFSALLDYFDGVLARKLSQNSNLGELIDPLADRLLIFVSLICGAFMHIIPVAIVVLIIFRELLLLVRILTSKVKLMDLPRVVFAGKAGSLIIMVSIAAFLLGHILYPFYLFALSTSIWGIYMYYFAAYLYFREYKHILKR